MLKIILKNYGACTYQSENKEIYDAIIKNSENNEITIISTNDSIIEKLDSMYKVSSDEYRYNFNGVIILRLKVLRYYQTLISNPNIIPNKDVLMYSITVLSMLNEEEYKTVENCISKIKFKGMVLI